MNLATNQPSTHATAKPSGSLSKLKTIASARLGLLLLIAIPSTTTAQTLTPYTASYKTNALGIGMTIKRELTRDEQGTYTLTNSGSVLIASIEESSRFRISNDQILGEQFDYQLGGLVRRKRAVRFDPEQGVIHSLRKKKWTEHIWEADILDRLSQQEQLRLVLMRSEAAREESPREQAPLKEAPLTPTLREDATLRAITFKVIDGPKVRERVIEWVGEEQVTVAAGTFDAWHFRQRRVGDERASDIWVAPSLDYLMVLARHREDSTLISLELLETSLTAASPVRKPPAT